MFDLNDTAPHKVKTSGASASIKNKSVKKSTPKSVKATATAKTSVKKTTR